MNDLEFVGDYRNPQRLTARQRELGFDGSSAGEFTFGDFIDIINPLQHIPIVSTLYREITGDEISPHARIFGDALFGGPTGFLSAAATAIYEEVAGEDIGETVLAFFTGESSGDEPQFAGGDAAAPGTAAALQGLPAAAAQSSPATAPPVPLATTGAPASGDPPDAASEAVLPDMNGAGMLTGQDALSALFNDLTRNRGSATPLPAAGDTQQAMPLPGRASEAQMESYPLPPRRAHDAAAASREALPAAPAGPAAAPGLPGNPAEAAAAHPLIFAQQAGENDIADRMMQALDKYAVMARQRSKDRNEAGDKTRWQSDPTLGTSGS